VDEERAKGTPAEGGESSRQAELIALAAEMFAERGYKGTTVRDIADRANILSGSLYHHFSSKEDILDAILSSYLTWMLGRYDAILAEGLGPRVTVEKLIHVSIVSVDERRAAIVIYQNEAQQLIGNERFEYLREASARIRSTWVGALRRGAQSGELRPDIDATLVYRFIRDSIWTIARWYRPDGPETADEIAAQFQRLVLDGVAARAPLGDGTSA
jgi:AcrR family transcriptional regulator